LRIHFKYILIECGFYHARPLVTAKSFVVANTSGNLANFACVEMDDAIIARAATGKTQFGSIRNISDPVQNSALTERFQGNWGEAIYTAYGIYTSYNGAVAAWALLNRADSSEQLWSNLRRA